MPLHLIVTRPGNLLSVQLEREISEAELTAIKAVLGVHDCREGETCWCAHQWPQTTLAQLQEHAEQTAAQREFREPGERVNGLYEVVAPGHDNHVAGDTID